MSTPNTAAAHLAELARLQQVSRQELLAALEGTDGNAPGDDTPSASPVPPTVAEYVEMAAGALLGNTERTYRTYWRVLTEGVRLPARWSAGEEASYLATARDLNRAKDLGANVPTTAQACTRTSEGALIIAGGLGERRLDRVGHTDLARLAKWVRLNAATTAALAGGRGDGKTAQTHFIEATRSLYRLADGDGLVALADSPAHRLGKPKRAPVPPQTMTDAQLEEVWQVCAAAGDDPDLDALLFRFLYLTGARQEGALNLRLRDLDFARQTLVLDQKGDQRHEVPVPVSLLEDLVVLAAARGSHQPGDPVFRQRRPHRGTGAPHPPLTRRRFNTVSARVRRCLPWAAQADWRPYWLRHQAGAEVEQVAGSAVKRQLLGHAPSSITDHYGLASLEHTAWATAQRSGEPHPLAVRPPWL